MVTQQLSVLLPQDQSILQQPKQLIAEISNRHLAFLLKYNNSIIGFELYDFDIAKSNWQNIFSATKNYSKFLGYNFSEVVFNLNFNEALVVPQQKFSKDSIEPYLTSIFGKNVSSTNHAEVVEISTKPNVVFRVPNSLNFSVQELNKNAKYTHIYTKILQQLLGSATLVMEIIKVLFYKNFMVVCVISNNKLQIIQTYNYNSAEDVVYYLLTIVQEFGLNVKTTPIEISGTIDLKSKHFELLENLFGRISFETVAAQGVFKEILNVANAHYYTPFYNLSL